MVTGLLKNSHNPKDFCNFVILNHQDLGTYDVFTTLGLQITKSAHGWQQTITKKTKVWDRLLRSGTTHRQLMHTCDRYINRYGWMHKRVYQYVDAKIYIYAHELCRGPHTVSA